jgi:hypothetical protein
MTDRTTFVQFTDPVPQLFGVNFACFALLAVKMSKIKEVRAGTSRSKKRTLNARTFKLPNGEMRRAATRSISPCTSREGEIKEIGAVC